MQEKNLYKVFIAMFAISTSVSLFNAFQDHKERKLRLQEFERKGITDGKS